MSDTSALPETGVLPGENPVGQLVLIPDAPLELANGWVTLAELAHENVPEPPKTLLSSIRRFGLLQPIVVRETMMDGSADGNHWDDWHARRDIVFGRRRLACCRALGIDPIPAIVIETDLAIADVMTLAENALRTSNPIAEYDAIERLIRKGATIKDISGATGMSQQTIKARQRLFNLDQTLLDGFREGKVSVSVAEAAAKLPKQVQKELAVAYFAEGKVTMTDVHDARTARTQQAMAQMEPFDFGTDDDGEPIDARIEEPPEFDQANRLAALADEIDPAQGAVVRAIRWCAAILMDIATGQRIDPRDFTMAPILSAPNEWRDPDPPPAFDQGAEASAVGFFGATMHYTTGQGVPSDATPNDAEVAQPNRVFTVNKIEEPEEEPEDMDTSDQEPYPAEQADDERHPGNWMNEVFER